MISSSPLTPVRTLLIPVSVRPLPLLLFFATFHPSKRNSPLAYGFIAPGEPSFGVGLAYSMIGDLSNPAFSRRLSIGAIQHSRYFPRRPIGTITWRNYAASEPACKGYSEVWICAEEGTRTPTALRPPAPKAGASANSATSAPLGRVYHSNCFPFVSGSAIASTAARKKAPASRKNEGPRPNRCAKIPIANGAAAEMPRPTL